MQPFATAGLLFVGYALVSLAWAPSINWFAVANLSSLVVGFCLGAMIKDLSRIQFWFVTLIAALIVFYLLLNTLNPNYAGAVIVMSLAIALSQQLYWFIPFAAAGLYFTQSRTSLIAGGIVLLVGIFRRFPAIAILSLVGAITLAITQRGFIDNSIWHRLGIWQDTVNHLTFFGSGLGSFLASYSAWPIHINSNMTIAPHTYNDILELLFEFGIGTIFLWVFLALVLDHKGPKLPVLAFFLLSLTYFPLNIPIVAQVFAISLGHLTRNPIHGTLATRSPSLSQR